MNKKLRLNISGSKYLFLLCLLFHGTLKAQVIPKSTYVIQNVSSDNANHPVADAFDADSTTWWALYNNAGFSLPGYVEIDLTTSYDIDGFTYLPNPSNSNEKAIGYEVYLSNDGINWGSPEVIGDFNWTSNSDVSRQTISFGAINARFAKISYTSSKNTGNGNIHTGDLGVIESSVPATGQQNQLLSISSVSNKYSSDLPFSLNGTASSGLPITYSVISGPAIVSGSVVTLNGGGIVTIKAEQGGNSLFYPAEQFVSFKVTDLSTIQPVLTTRLTEDYPLLMDALKPYPIYMNSSILFEDSLAIDSIKVTVGGVSGLAQMESGFYYYLWTPDSYGNHQVEITSYASNGLIATILRDVEVANNAVNQNVGTLDGVNITFNGANSRWYTGTYSLPQHVGSFNQVVANLTVSCPNTSAGCDDWDRYAYAMIKAPDGNWIQLFNYITPYGVACNHSIDVSDYESLLQGEFEIRVFIDTWGTGGWVLNLDFDFIAGTPFYDYSRVDEIWDGKFDFGNPQNLQPLDTVTFGFHSNAEKAKMKMTTIGQGWGNNNSQNAAEFYHATHYLHINNNQEFVHEPWRDCNPNPDNCTGQQGTWQYSRAGWCPGAISLPFDMNLDGFIQNSVDFSYIFDPTYTDYCHPNNPACVNNVTCPDCNDSYKATFAVDAHVISYGDQPLLYASSPSGFVNQEINYELNLFPNPTTSHFNIMVKSEIGESRVTISTVGGQSLKTYYFNSSIELSSFNFDVSGIPSGVYFVNVENQNGVGVQSIIVQ